MDILSPYKEIFLEVFSLHFTKVNVYEHYPTNGAPHFFAVGADGMYNNIKYAFSKQIDPFIPFYKENLEKELLSEINKIKDQSSNEKPR